MKFLIIVFAQLFAFAAFAEGGGTKIGNGSSGLYGAEVQRPIPPGPVVVVPPPMSNADRISVYGSFPGDQSRYCVQVLKDSFSPWKTGIDFGGRIPGYNKPFPRDLVCPKLNEPYFVKGNKTVVITFGSHSVFYEKRSGVALDVKLGRIDIPADETISSASIRVDVTDKKEQDILLFRFYLAGVSLEAFEKPFTQQEKDAYASGDYRVLNRFISFDQDRGVVTGTIPDDRLEENKKALPGSSTYVLPGTYLVEWKYKNGSSNYTTGIKVQF